MPWPAFRTAEATVQIRRQDALTPGGVMADDNKHNGEEQAALHIRGKLRKKAHAGQAPVSSAIPQVGALEPSSGVEWEAVLVVSR